MRTLLTVGALAITVAGCADRGCQGQAPGPPPVVEMGRVGTPAAPSQGMRQVEVLDLQARPAGGLLLLLREQKGQRRVVPMVIGDAEGHALSLRMAREEFTRPLTHDLLETVLEEFGVRVIKLEIDDLKESVFLGRLFLRDRERSVVRLDTRPSDGIALALGADAPIYMSRSVVRSVGESPHDWGVPVPFGSPDPPQEETGLRGLIGLSKSSKSTGEPAVEEPPPIELGVGLGPEQLTLLYTCWFTEPYEYMFGGRGEASVSIMGKTYGRFMAGIGGILHYGSLSACVADLSDAVKGSYSDVRPLAELAGLPLHGARMNEKQPFGFYNVELVRWGHENLIPDPQISVGDVSAQRIYDVVFARFFRMIYLNIRRK